MDAQSLPRQNQTWTEETEGRKSIFFLETPTLELDLPDLRPPPTFGAFLQACRACGHSLYSDKPVFMYGELGAFCSPECRESQMNADLYYVDDDSRLIRQKGRRRRHKPIYMRILLLKIFKIIRFFLFWFLGVG